MYGGHPRLFLELARHGGIELAISEPLLDEVLDVLQRKFLLSPHDARENIQFIESFTRRVHPARVIDAIAEDPDDNRVLECAAENVSDFIVTHDKDLLRRKRFEGIPIVKVGPFLDRGFGIRSWGKRR
jgi:putative PIN family toxin of toxin-antitoxin system